MIFWKHTVISSCPHLWIFHVRVDELSDVELSRYAYARRSLLRVKSLLLPLAGFELRAAWGGRCNSACGSAHARNSPDVCFEEWVSAPCSTIRHHVINNNVYCSLFFYYFFWLSWPVLKFHWTEFRTIHFTYTSNKLFRSTVFSS